MVWPTDQIVATQKTHNASQHTMLDEITVVTVPDGSCRNNATIVSQLENQTAACDK